jgi:DNA-binding CsgD family transcriptional regulator
MRQTGGPPRSREGYHWFRGWRRPTTAQRRVLDELVAGGTNAQIAARLGISEDGVKWHLSELRDEVGLAGRRELAEWWTEERRRPAVNLLFPFAAMWRFATQNAVATVVVVGVVAASLAVGWFAFDALSGDDEANTTGVAPLRTPDPAAAVPFVPTPTPTPGPRGALLFDVAAGEALVLPGEFIDRRWLDSEAMTFTVYNRGSPAYIDAEGEITPISERTGVSFLPDADRRRVVVWDYDGGLLEVVNIDTLEVVLSGEFGPSIPSGYRRWAVSPVAGKVAILDEPYVTVIVYDLDASNSQTIFTAEPDRWVSHFAWSRGGEWLLVVSALKEDVSPGRSDERAYVFDLDGRLVLERETGADWAGTQTLRLRKRDDMVSGGGPLITDALLDVAHESEIPVPEGMLLCVSPDSRYAVLAERGSGLTPSWEHELYDLVTREVVVSATMGNFLINCDWTPDGSKVVLSDGGK